MTTIPVWVEQQNGTFTAAVPGAPELRGDGPTESLAVEAVRRAIRVGTAAGRLVLVNVGTGGVSGLAGAYQDDPTLLDICAEAYRLRDEQKAAELAEHDRP